MSALKRTPLIAFLFAGAWGCDALLEVPPPPVVPPGVLDDPAFAVTAVQGAVADFECALANYVVATALVTDELISSSSFGPVVNWDRRTAYESGAGQGCVPGSSFNLGVYTPLSTARFQADDVFRRLQRFDSASVPAPGRTALLAIAATYAGYSFALMGEGFCEAAFDLGPALPWQEVLALAEERFTTALTLAQSAGIDSIVNFALVGRARVRLGLDDRAGAASDARAVLDTAFATRATYSTANRRRENRVYESNQYVSVDPRFRNLAVDGVPDPRVPVTDEGRSGSDGVTPVWLQRKYASASSPIVIASWREAQLIIAEAEGGQSAVAAINGLRTTAGLPLFASTGPDTIAMQVRIERQRELFLQGHRLNDMLRFGIPLDTITHRGLATGDLTCLRLPHIESDNNPNIGGTRRTTR